MSSLDTEKKDGMLFQELDYIPLFKVNRILSKISLTFAMGNAAGVNVYCFHIFCCGVFLFYYYYLPAGSTDNLNTNICIFSLGRMW